MSKESNIYQKALGNKPEADDKSQAATKLLGAINRCFASEDGKIVLRWLGDVCDWYGPTVCMNPKSLEANALMTLATATKQDVYRMIRAHVVEDTLKKVEFVDHDTTTKQEG